MQNRRQNWCDPEWWNEQIYLATRTADPVLCNLRITLGHYELSLALRDLLGHDTGANFHTWAVWGSRKAGKTIRQEDIPGLKRVALLLGGMGGLAGAFVLGRRWSLSVRSTALLAGIIVGGLGSYLAADRGLDDATRNILGGNITVLEDIGHTTACFICAFHNHLEPDTLRLEEFLASLRPGPTEEGGQDLLREAFTRYYLAWHEPDLNAKHEHMLLANLSAILHEHIRLQPFISGAMPAPLRRWITSRLLHYQVGMQTMCVDEDILPWRGESAPTSLERLENPDLVRFLSGPEGWDRTPGSYTGSRAANWSDIRDRMNYICDLFRSRHFDPGLFTSPYTGEQWAALLQGRVPDSPL